MKDNFDTKRKRETMLESIEEVEKIKRGEIQAKSYNNLDELIKDLEKEIEEEES